MLHSINAHVYCRNKNYNVFNTFLDCLFLKYFFIRVWGCLVPFFKELFKAEASFANYGICQKCMCLQWAGELWLNIHSCMLVCVHFIVSITVCFEGETIWSCLEKCSPRIFFPTIILAPVAFPTHSLTEVTSMKLLFIACTSKSTFCTTHSSAFLLGAA